MWCRNLRWKLTQYLHVTDTKGHGGHLSLGADWTNLVTQNFAPVKCSTEHKSVRVCGMCWRRTNSPRHPADPGILLHNSVPLGGLKMFHAGDIGFFSKFPEWKPHFITHRAGRYIICVYGVQLDWRHGLGFMRLSGVFFWDVPYPQLYSEIILHENWVTQMF